MESIAQQPLFANEFRVVEWRAVSRNTLQGFFTLALPSGLVIKDLSLHAKPDGGRWISVPSRSFNKDDGSIAYINLFDFIDAPTRRRFLKSAMDALDSYLENLETGSSR